MKRTLALLLCVAVIIGGLCGCGTKNANGGEVPTLVWYTFEQSQSDLQLVLEEANKIIEPAIGAKLDLQIIDPGAYTEKMKMKMASREEFDLCFVGYNNGYVEAVENGGIAPLTELIEEYAPEIYDNVDDTFLDDATIDGEIYAIPNVQVGFVQQASWVQKEILDASGLEFDEVNEMKDLEPLFEFVKANYPDVIPWQIGFGINMWTVPKYETISADIVISKDAEKPEALIIRDTPEYKDGLNTIREWYKKGYIRQDIATVQDDSMDLRNGKYAVFQANWKPGHEKNVETMYGRKYVPIKMSEPYMNAGFSRSTMIGVSETSKHKDKAIQLISLMNSNKELYNLICFGIEGKHYTINSEGKAVVNAEAGYNISTSAWKYGNQFNAYVTDGMDATVWEDTMNLNKEASKSPLIGFQFDSSAVLNEASQIGAIITEYGVIHRGYQEPSEYFDNMEKRIKNAGEEVLLKEIQTQIAEFTKKK